MRKAVFPGSFDPITLGHFDIVERGVNLFDEVVIAIGTNATKNYMFSQEERKTFAQKAFQHIKKVTVITYQGLTVELCQQLGANYILRGLRNPADFEFEKAIAHTNRKLADIETVFLLTSSGKSFISSSIVRDVIRNGGDYTLFVPDAVRI